MNRPVRGEGRPGERPTSVSRVARGGRPAAGVRRPGRPTMGESSPGTSRPGKAERRSGVGRPATNEGQPGRPAPTGSRAGHRATTANRPSASRPPVRSEGRRHARPQAKAAAQDGERLQKILARAGVASRRAAEEMIAAGRVTVNGTLVTEMGARADPAKDTIKVDGTALNVPALETQAQEMVYIAMHKPKDVVSTAKDTHGRPTVLDLLRGTGGEERGVRDQGPGIRGQGPGGSSSQRGRPTPNTQQPSPDVKQRVYPVGRLDADSTGLLLLTNDGDLTFRLTHPKYGVEKEYRVLVRGKPGEAVLNRLREGVEIEGEITAPAKVEELGRRDNDTWLRITIREGRKRQVRLMAAAVGYHVVELQRVRFGPILLGNLIPGKWRYLAQHEIHALRKAVKLPISEHAKRPAR
ncbi:MAG TPA: pseudouridine synthase [Chloroflexia bacterium]|nr:pseudouridine synthase [Chloroflexia bacterium]